MKPSKSLEDEIKDNVNTTNDSTCWIWQGKIDNHGYGKTRVKSLGINGSAHRLAWVSRVGEIQNGECIINTCGDRGCINPRHHRVGTKSSYGYFEGSSYIDRSNY